MITQRQSRKHEVSNTLHAPSQLQTNWLHTHVLDSFKPTGQLQFQMHRNLLNAEISRQYKASHCIGDLDLLWELFSAIDSCRQFSSAAARAATSAAAAAAQVFASRSNVERWRRCVASSSKLLLNQKYSASFLATRSGTVRFWLQKLSRSVCVRAGVGVGLPCSGTGVVLLFSGVICAVFIDVFVVRSNGFFKRSSFASDAPLDPTLGPGYRHSRNVIEFRRR